MKEILTSLSELIRSLNRIVISDPSIAFEADIRRLESAKKVLSDYSSNDEPGIIQSTTNSTPKQLLPIIEKVFGPGAAKGCAERLRQIEVEGWTPEHDDDCNKCNQLALAAALYLLPKAWREDTFILVSIYWPWNVKWWKPTPDNRIRELEKGIALGMAEIDRLKRKEENK